MADDSSRIGSTRSTLGMDLLRQVSGVSGAASGAGGGAISAASGSGGTAPRGAFGQRGNRMLPADYPEDQLDRRAARGTYIDILV